MTNAEKFKEVFGIEIDCGSCNPYPCNENDCEFLEKCESEPGLPCDSWWDWEFKEPTTENDLEGDCISRFEVTEIINEEWDTDIILDRIEALPSVTPQEPILDKLRAKMEEISSNMNPEDEWDYGYKAGVEDLIQFLEQDLKEHKTECEAEDAKKSESEEKS